MPGRDLQCFGMRDILPPNPSTHICSWLFHTTSPSRYARIHYA